MAGRTRLPLRTSTSVGEGVGVRPTSSATSGTSDRRRGADTGVGRTREYSAPRTGRGDRSSRGSPGRASTSSWVQGSASMSRLMLGSPGAIRARRAAQYVDAVGRLYSPRSAVISLAKPGAGGVVGLVGFGAIVLLAVGLAMDATAVAAARGLAVPAVRLRHMVLVAVFFGGAQALMPLIGWVVGARVGPLVQAWDHWIVFVLLGALGGKMLYEARGDDDDDEAATDADPFALRVMLLLAVATSIDALAVGFTLPMMQAPLVLSLVTIGVTTAVLSVAGLWVGRRFGALLGPRLDIAGGLVLILIGTKVLVEHLSA